MNPPSALYGAMNRERKPFTYTPGGLDLSEIKSERMAKRLMRNAMNQGVPEVPVQQIQSPPSGSNPIAIPNFNCLPVQVFPTFNLPANPKSLLRTRSNPDNPRDPIQRASQSQIPKPSKVDNNTKTFSQINNNNPPYQRPVSMYDHSTLHTLPRTNYSSNEMAPLILPEISYEAEYFQTSLGNDSNSINKPLHQLGDTFNLEDKNTNQISIETNGNSLEKTKQQSENPSEIKVNIIASVQTTGLEPKPHTTKDLELKIGEIKQPIENNAKGGLIESKDESDVKIYLDNKLELEKSEVLHVDDNPNLDLTKEPLSGVNFTPLTDTSPLEEYSTSDDEQKSVKVVKKQVKKETKSEVQNGSHNGDSNLEAELTVKLPTKKTAAKTETNVEVVKKHLPDGSIEEVKTTTTKTTVDGKTTISTKTETTIIPKQEEEEVEEEVEEEEEEVEENGDVVDEEVEELGDKEESKQVVVKESSEETKPVEKNGDKIITNEERSETTTTTTKKVTVVEKEQSDEEEEVEEEEEVTEEKPSKVEKSIIVKEEPTKVEDNEEEEEEEEIEEEIVEEKQEQTTKKENVIEKKADNVDKEEEEVVDKNEEEVTSENQDKNEEVIEEKEEVAPVEQEEKPVEQSKDEESEYTEEEYESEKEEVTKTELKPADKEEISKPEENEKKSPAPEKLEEVKTESASTPKPIPESTQPSTQGASHETSQPAPQTTSQPAPQSVSQPEPKVPLREPSIPLEKVEDVEIKPIGPVHETVTKSHSENTEIITTEKPSGPLRTQTEYNRIENIVTVNRTTKTLVDQLYDNTTQHGVPTVKTYFAPTRERISTSPSKPHQPVYSPVKNPPTERRHSLLLERLSMERQLPSSDIYQNNYPSSDQQPQWTQEPQAEVLVVSNVKPSKITNQQWYQQSKKDNVSYSNTVPTTPATQTWKQPPLQQQQSAPASQTQLPIQPQPQPQIQPTYQPQYTESTTNTYQQNSYQTFPPKSTTWGTNSLSNTDSLAATYNTPSNQYSFNKNSTESYQKTTQQYSSSYVPPPWEQDSNYVVDDSNKNQYQIPPSTNQYQTPPLSSTFTPSSNQGWTPAPPKSKFTKPPPTAYIPPAPNQSFVKNAMTAEPPRVPGKKTYYSEYERRYITVPESTYVPSETKPSFQPQPDPSPQYYFDNNEPVETVEPQWRKELREFTEKTSQTQHTEQINVKPPWEEDPKYAKAPSSTYTPTPTWSQTLRPQSWRERSFESDYVGSQEVTKNNTLGRGRPLSSYVKSNIETIPERTRGVSVDRYNPNVYQSPITAEHPPVQTHVHNVVPPAKSYHNPNIPAYHTQPRASAEPREQTAIYQQPRQWGEARASPIQSRSFKYLQWITGTDN